jgi:6-methylsalicylate decarboxylase
MCNLCISRREVLKLAATSAITATAGCEPAQTKPYRVDVHYHHITPSWISEEAVERSFAPQVIGKAKRWTPNGAIEEMDRNDVATVICSVSNPGIWFGDVAQSRRLARECNEYAARIRDDHRGRFGCFAALPLPDTEGSLAEIAYALDVLKSEGIGLFTSYDDKWLADPAFSSVFEELNRRKGVVYVHPIAPACCRNLFPNIPGALLEYPIDTTRTIVDWIMAKCTSRYPDIRMIFSHAGGLIMAGVGRLQMLAATQGSMEMPESFPAEIAKFYYEISSSSDAVTMGALRAYVPTSHILLGTDSPFIGPMAPNIDQLLKLGLPAADLSAIERANAVALMPRIRQSGFDS